MKKESNKNIPVVILCGGMGTRLVEYLDRSRYGTIAGAGGIS